MNEVWKNEDIDSCAIVGVAKIDGTQSHDVIRMALEGLTQMEHRGGKIADRGDGVGVLISTCREFFAPYIQHGRHIPDNEDLTVADAFFLPDVRGDTMKLQDAIDAEVIRSGFQPLGWRRVPTDYEVLPAVHREAMPEIWQILLGRGYVSEKSVSHDLYLLRSHLGAEFRGIYFPSFTADAVVYKTLGTAENLNQVFPDLRDPNLKTKIAIGHRRYSTNTIPRSVLVQPFSMSCHNGEINTIRANREAVRNFEKELDLFFKVLMRQGSDSADMDRMLELFTCWGGVSAQESLRRFMIPAFRDRNGVPEEARSFYEGCRRALRNLAVLEGPAAVLVSDGRKLIAGLDRMGLRPLRFCTTKDGFFIAESEIGACDIPFENILRTGQLDAGEILIADTDLKRIFMPNEVEELLPQSSPLNFQALSNTSILIPEASARHYEFKGNLDKRLAHFGWHRHRKKEIIDMFKQCKELVGAMGYTKPLACLSESAPTLFKYLKQIGAVITNPPIDYVREKEAFDLTTYLGRAPKVSAKEHTYRVYPQYKLESPFITDSELDAIVKTGREEGMPKAKVIEAVFEAGNVENMTDRIREITDEVLKTVRKKEAQIIILCDRNANCENLPLPSLLLVSAVNKALKDVGLRRQVSLVSDSGEIQEAHDAACLIAHGADAINPYMMWHIAYSFDSGADSENVEKLREVLNQGLMRVMSKIGITTLDGYRDSHLFEAIGLDSRITEYYLDGVPSYFDGIGMQEIYEDIRKRAGLQELPRDADENAYNQRVVKALRRFAFTGKKEDYEAFKRAAEETNPVYLRDLLEFRDLGEYKIPVSEVMPAEEIVSRYFAGAAMSHGALHFLPHMAIAEAFNSLNSRSNCGEGGEDESRNTGGANEKRRSKVRQYASGRFGVDASYLAFADEIQVKDGQGAKGAGEPGYIEGDKINEQIAGLRHTSPWVRLISPSTHHNKYSIEDHAERCAVLKEFNPGARISSKIPIITGCGIIALGIVKGGYDIIELSGYDGGTGATAKTSLEHAGLPLERGIAETHQVLTENGIRDWVELRADAGMKTGLDVAKIFALGAQQATFGTALLVAIECTMCRQCYKGSCPVGLTTCKDETAFHGLTDASGAVLTDPEKQIEEGVRRIKNYLLGVSEDLRDILARLGIKDPKELVGRVDLLKQTESENNRHKLLDLSLLLRDVSIFADRKLPNHVKEKVKREISENLGIGVSKINEEIVTSALEGQKEICLTCKLDESGVGLGARLAALIGSKSLKFPEEGFMVKIKGYAGNSFAFAATSGMKFELDGFANDSCGEAISGAAKIVIRPPNHGDLAAGNALGYGATGGTIYAAGKVGLRSACRNSGATIITEGTGKYPAEYMTMGIYVDLGKLGNVACAGMTGGEFFTVDPDVENKIHKDSVKVVPLAAEDFEKLKVILDDYVKETESLTAKAIIDDWENRKHEFKKIAPKQRPKAPPKPSLP